MAETMRAVDIKNGKGPASSLFINDKTPKPVPKKSQALVKIKYFGLNRMDLSQRQGLYPLPPQAGPILGVEFSGTIEGFGEDAEKGFKIGDEVFGLAYGGAYAEYITINTHMLIHKPANLSWEEAAGIPETWITATQALYLVGGFTEGKTVLWHAGASSVSIAGQQLSHSSNAKAVYATTRSDEKNEWLKKELKTTGAFNQTGDWASEVLTATEGKGVDLIIDFLGATTFSGNLKALARDGVLVGLGQMGGSKLPEGIDIGPLVYKRIRIEGSTLRSRNEVYQGKLRDQLVDHALPKFEDGSFKVVIEKVMDWKDIVKAHELMESNQTKGKIICRVT
jgi:NADPH:quinone reductase-like Zn-dependent oxidoreductase